MNTQLWLGDEASFDKYLAILKKIEEASPELLAQAKAFDNSWDTRSEEEDPEHWMLDMQGEVALITVTGPMVKGSVGFWGKYFGYVGYDDIMEACSVALERGATKALFDWDSPGGMAAGIEDANQYLLNFSEQVDTTSYTSNMVASACLWLATTADKFYASKMANVGSIGVIAVQKEMTEMLKMDGIKATVFRSAPLKALGGPYEKLSDLAKETIQRDIDTSHQFFVDAITANCGLPRDYVAAQLATGELWYGADALDKGLIDGVKTFDEVFVALTRENVENTTDYKNTPPEVHMKKTRISAKTQAAVASGIPLDVALEAESETTEVEETETEVEETPATEVEETPATEVTQPEASGSSLIKELTNELVASKVALAAAESQLTSMQGSHDSMKKIVSLAIQRCYIGMGSPAPTMDGLMALDASLLVTQHADADAQLQKRFGLGGQASAAVNAEEEDDKVLKEAQEKQLDYEQSLRLEQARIKKPT